VVNEGSVYVTDALLSTVIEAAGGQTLWNTPRGLTVDLSIGGPTWAMTAWPAGATALAAFKGHLRPTPSDTLHLGYFLGYANWNYFTTAFQDGDTKLAVDQPSLLFASYDTPDIAEVGDRLDYLLSLLIINMGGEFPSEMRHTA
jgi:hypothetical protein